MSTEFVTFIGKNFIYDSITISVTFHFFTGYCAKKNHQSNGINIGLHSHGNRMKRKCNCTLLFNNLFKYLVCGWYFVKILSI